MISPVHALFRAWLLVGGVALFTADAFGGASTNSAWFVRAWQSGDGLPNNNVHALAQTSDGYLWVATPVGLARFDGDRFEAMSLTNVLSSNRGVMALVGSGGGGLWLEMDRGAVVRLNEGQVTIRTPTNGLPDLIAQGLVEGEDGTLWISYLGGTICSMKGDDVMLWTLQSGGLPWGSVSSVAKDNEGRIWLGRAGNIGVVRDGRFELVTQVGKVATRLCGARRGGIWVCAGTRLVHLDENGTTNQVGSLERFASSIEPTVLLEDDAGAVWVGTSYAGLFRYSDSGLEQVSTSHPEILSLLEDTEGNLWVGTRGGGLNRVRPRAVRLEGTEAGLPFDAVQSVCEDRDGTLWAVTANGLVARRTGDGWTTVSTGTEWRGVTASCVAADPSGGVWIGTRNRRLIRWRDDKIDAWTRSSGLEVSPILTILVSRKGELWVGGQNQVVQCLRDGRWVTYVWPGDTRVFRAAAEDAAGNIWFGTSRGLLLRVSGDGFVDETARTAAPHKSIRCLYATPDGSLWIGYAGWGLGRLRGGKGTILRKEHGLLDEFISQIVADDRGWLWFGADHGIFKVRLQQLDAVAEGRSAKIRAIDCGRAEGLPHLQADFGYVSGAARSRDGRLWIPTRSALAVVDPDKLRESLETTPVLLTRVSVDEEEVISYRGIMSTNKGGMRERLRMAPGHRKLEFEFTALSFAAPENVRFQYRLENFDGAWIESDTRRVVSYPRLPAGDYRFHVKACNSSGVWSEGGATLAFTVTPFLWRTWWFQLASFGLFTSTVIMVVRYVSFRRLRIRLRTLEQQAALERERARIARDLHDDLGSRLTRIVLLSDLLLDYRSEPEKSGQTAEQVSSAARQVIKALDETVWAVNPRNDTLSHLINYIGQFAVEFLRTAGIRCQVDLPERPPERPVSAEVRHNLFLVVKEALNNVVRHASATEVMLRVTVTEESVSLVIEDDGHGFDRTPDDESADGLRNMRQRIEEIGGRFHIDGKGSAGARITVVAPWSRK